MPVKRKLVAFNAGTASPGLQVTTDPEHGTFAPSVIITQALYTGSANNAYFHFGCAAKTGETVTQWAQGLRSGNNASRATVRSARYTDRAWLQVISSGIGCYGTLAFEANGFTPTVEQTNSDVLVQCLALGGDITDAYAVAVQLLETDADSIKRISVPFAPDSVLACAAALGDVDATNAGNASWTLGWAARGGGRGCTATRHVHDADPVTVWSAQRTDLLYRGLASGSTFYDLDVAAWGEEWIDLQVIGSPSSAAQQYVYLLCLKGGKVGVGAFTGNGAATQAVPVSGITPVAALMQSWGRPTSEIIVDGDVLYSLGMTDGVAQMSQWASDDDAVGTTNADGTYTTDSLIYIGTVDAPATVQAEAALDSFESEAVNLAWSPADSVGREILMLVVGDEVAAEITLAASGSVGAIAGAAGLSVGEPGIELSASGSMSGLVGDAKLTVPHQVHLSGGLVMGGIVTAYHGLPLAASGAVGSEAGTATLTSTLPLAAAGAIGSQAGDAALTVELALAAAGVVGVVDGEAALTSDLPLEAAGAIGALSGSTALTVGEGELELSAAGVIGAVDGSVQLTTDLALAAAGAVGALGGSAQLESGLQLAATGVFGSLSGAAALTTTLPLAAAGAVASQGGAVDLLVGAEALSLAAAGAVGQFSGSAQLSTALALFASGAIGQAGGSVSLIVGELPVNLAGILASGRAARVPARQAARVPGGV